MVRVLVAEDSPLMRRVLIKILQKSPFIKVIDYATNGQEAIEKVASLRPDVVTMDVEMPVLNGLEALKAIMQTCPTPVLMISTLTQKGAEVTLKALSLGAVDFIPKPSAYSSELESIENEIIKKVLNAAKANVFGKKVGSLNTTKIISVSKKPLVKPNAIFIGVSTGGPKTLGEIIPYIKSDIGVPIFIVQHMPPNFTRQLASTLSERSSHFIKEAEKGEFVKPNTVYIAPGGKQMELIISGGRTVINIVDGPNDLIYKPSVDYVGFSLANHYKDRLVAIMLTGMGNDGAKAFAFIKKLGGFIIAEDQSTAIIFGMPKSVIDQGIADLILPCTSIAGAINSIFS
ncbi:two-component system chemotaxis response regulator CheB [Caldicellulosiruptor bescii]|uniref:Protein-glutamate methylesterase/protein-glutamine glutaminase n=2 Tax=Caldicellulosiruptor bescii TaxID=31899 RepID=B9MPE1_CALBD|nr:chemotaxis response regulator protein-glutamate methylesterase [Caldicellulosiruptor bescii]ACM59702.1 response regulator receiver modulated CheB methylesterase [Caldicellulosiruptor bescii DSM 6725]PBC89727.1 two-component system chemotaxis response regulator CheB [Caldicellulosiruptor bescii]PBC90050.1 two-component system chemotaxis response regulator CheB [Caldicellulosiruptor bescii]PBD04519.1 two-component system chemotaxis response regulator CheB [Caldicellulosiruptor bescii]PBD05847